MNIKYYTKLNIFRIVILKEEKLRIN